MAYLNQNDGKLLQDPDQNNQSQMTGQSDSALVGGNSANVAAGTSTAGIGAGGTGGWTNIQAYLNANKGVDTGASDLVSKDAGSQFDQEKTNLTQDADKQKQAAVDQAKPINDVKANANNYLDQAANSYNYNAPSGEGYGKAISAFQGALEGKYQGPTSYNYGFTDKTQQKGSALGSDDAFNQYLGDLYQNKAGGQLSSGGRELQKQLNISNDSLTNTRQNLLKQYSGLGDYRDQTVKDTNSAIGQAANDYQSGQSYLRDFLNNKSSELDSSIAKQESDARDAYQNTLNSKSGRSAASWGTATDNPLHGGNLAQAQQRAGLYSDNLTFDQLAKEQEAKSLTGARMGDLFANPYNAVTSRGLENKNFLDQFNNAQFEKYSNTADKEERQWNAIRDILRSSDKRKEQGFKVRG